MNYSSICLIICVGTLYAPVHLVRVTSHLDPAKPHTVTMHAVLFEHNERQTVYTVRLPIAGDESITKLADQLTVVFWINDCTLCYSKTPGQWFVAAEPMPIAIPRSFAIGSLMHNLDPRLHYWVAVTFEPRRASAQWLITQNSNPPAELALLTS